ncbi:serine dehydratase subunit alpha family protein [Marinitoga litoralis]|uniref:L-cysteine desulfidase family protein n=1 Tax=Marinitoga litoralis TaxID=570855 RepID=UPI00196190A6|nr:L-serine ammonia-lyase, iron-sulfur-dependent, subunit alpha [Marinitoga litoralis]MBM7558341.1 L-cysteine desulfidase [Marinitoga litoralis]
MLKEILFDQVKPAYGCTEPIAVALAVATAKKYLKGELESINITLDKNTYKNGLEVNIPGTSFIGLEIAASLSYVCGNSEYGLEVLKDVNQECIDNSHKYLGKIKLNVNKEYMGLKVDCTIIGDNSVNVVIEDKHDNVAHIEVDGEQIYDRHFEAGGALLDEIKKYNIDDLIDYLDKYDMDVDELLEKTMNLNTKIAEKGLKTDGNFGHVLDFEPVNIVQAAVDARMSGELMPVMTVAGSGNQGLSSTLPIIKIGRKYDNEKVKKAMLLSILVTIYIKSYTGLLTPICGAGTIASAGVSAGITYLKGGNNDQIKHAINNVLSTLFGLTCDGAKKGCALKAGTGTFVALQSSELALNDINVPCGNGIAAKDVEETIKRVGKLTESIKKFDEDVLDYIGKC